MKTQNVDNGAFIGHEMQAKATFIAYRLPNVAWEVPCFAGEVMYPEGVATLLAIGIGIITQPGEVMFRVGCSFEITYEAFSAPNEKKF
mgnify:FL=1